MNHPKKENMIKIIVKGVPEYIILTNCSKMLFKSGEIKEFTNEDKENAMT